MSVLSVTVTERGRAMAARLPFPHTHGQAADAVRDRWNDVEGFVLFLATGAAVRIIAPLLQDKHHDPAVVCVDEAGRCAVALTGGHSGGANRLCRQVAALLGADPIVTTASDAIGQSGLDMLPGFTATGDLGTVAAALLDERRVALDNPHNWPLPASLAGLHAAAPVGSPRIVVTDEVETAGPGVVVLHPESLVVGIGGSSGPSAAELSDLLEQTLSETRLARASVSELVTIDRRADEPALRSLGLPVRAFTSEALAKVPVPNPSDIVETAVGTPSVAEAAALAAAGPDATLLVPKRKGQTITLAIARRQTPRGHLAVVGLGPGGPEHRTPAASAAIAGATVVIGYRAYVEQCADAIASGAVQVCSEIGSETARAVDALTRAAAGERVALVCSGDAGIYAMASLVFECSTAFASLDPNLDVSIVPGVTAALATAAALGSPLGHDHVAISLSDLLTPWEVIERRLVAAAEADLVVSLYNPRSAGRTWQLDKARHLLLAHRRPDTPVGIVHDAGRTKQRTEVTTLAALNCDSVGMSSCVIVGSTRTRFVGGRMVTPRGYAP